MISVVKPVVALLILPFTRAELALDEHLRTLAQVLGGDLAQAPEQGDAVPLGALLLCAGGLVLPGLAGGNADIRDRHAARHRAGLGVSAQIPDQNDFIDAASHDISSTLDATYCTRVGSPHMRVLTPALIEKCAAGRLIVPFGAPSPPPILAS